MSARLEVGFVRCFVGLEGGCGRPASEGNSMLPKLGGNFVEAVRAEGPQRRCPPGGSGATSEG